MIRGVTVLVAVLALCAGKPTVNTADPVIIKYSEDRFQYMTGPHGQNYLVDLWMKKSDLVAAARFNPDSQNVYHLFTRQNPTVSQPLLLNSDALLGATNFNPVRRTVVLIHGWLDSVTGDFNAVLVNAFLTAADVNVIVVDWSAGSGSINYLTALANTVTSGQGVARFINWLNRATGATADQYHLVGHSLGGHQVGIVGRNVEGVVPYITSIDPASPGWNTHSEKFRADDGGYTEVIHTNVGLLGYMFPLGHVDFYPNGGIDMPGCDSQSCDHDRGFYYLAESITSGGFRGRRCVSYLFALAQTCSVSLNRLNMGGLIPKTGANGVYLVATNPSPPFSQQ